MTRKYRVVIEYGQWDPIIEEFEADTPEEAEEIGRDIFLNYCSYGVSEIQETTK